MDEMNQYNYQVPSDPQIEKDANTSKILGIVSIVCALCCTIAGIIVGAIGFVKANNVQNSMDASEKAKSDANVGKICSIIGIVLAVLNMIAGAIMGGAMGSIIEEAMGMLQIMG